MKRQVLTSLLLIIVSAVVACTTTTAPPASTDTSPSAANDAQPSAAPRTGPAPGEMVAERNVPKLANFAFDSSAIEGENRRIVERNARYLSANPQLKVRLAGHCDERGTREYNLGLGERRAHAVKRMMGILGVAENRIATVSFGEEKPLANGHDESAWQQNRRVEFIYL